MSHALEGILAASHPALRRVPVALHGAAIRAEFG